MSYTVVWTKKAQDCLTREWLDAPSARRAEINAACEKIEAGLKTSPEELGESRASGRRIAIERPLSVLFKILDQDRLVEVLDVHVHKANP